MTSPLRERTAFAPPLLLAACVVRCGILWTFASGLNEDRDAYLAIARQLQERGEFASSPGDPTAYRPPLYPLLLAPIAAPEHAPFRGLLHLALSLGTLGLIWRIGGRLELPILPRWSATAVCAFDPVMLRYLAFPMTETLSAFLTALLLDRLLAFQAAPSRKNGVAAGVVFALSVLCRPTFWVFGGLLFSFWMIRPLMRRLRNRTATENSSPTPPQVAWVALATVLAVSPWVIRNTCVMGSPILMTTHGGYTILLGNNVAYYREVVEQPWGTVWDGSRGPGQSGWIDSLTQEMESANVHSEVDQDRWMNRRAWDTIHSHPSLFLQACRLRFLSFWSVLPGGEWSSSIPRPLLFGVACWYVLIWLAFATGLLTLVAGGHRSRAKLVRWVPVALLVVSLTLVHLVYWTDARMRAPTMPAIALIAVAWMPGLRWKANSSWEKPG